MLAGSRLPLFSTNPFTRYTEKPATPTVTNSRKAEIPAYRSLIYSRKAETSAWKFREKKLLKIMLCLGTLGLGTPCCGSSGVRGLSSQLPSQPQSQYHVLLLDDNRGARLKILRRYVLLKRSGSEAKSATSYHACYTLRPVQPPRHTTTQRILTLTF